MHHPVSVAQQTANRANALHSTGPRTEEGKTASSQNARRHGLTSQTFAVLDWESQDDYDQLLADFRAEHQPSTATENALVDKLAQHHWLSLRAATLQEGCFHGQRPGQCADLLLAVYLRYQAHHDRAFEKSLNQLHKLRREREREHSGFVSQTLRIAEGHKRDDRHFLQLELLKLRLEKAKQATRPVPPPPIGSEPPSPEPLGTRLDSAAAPE